MKFHTQYELENENNYRNSLQNYTKKNDEKSVFILKNTKSAK